MTVVMANPLNAKNADVNSIKFGRFWDAFFVLILLSVSELVVVKENHLLLAGAFLMFILGKRFFSP